MDTTIKTELLVIAAYLAFAGSPEALAQKAASGGAAAPVKQATLFGITIGRQIDSYPSCESEEGRQKICVYPPDPSLPTQRFIELRPGKAEFLRSNFSIGIRPDGTINFASVETGGAKYQEEIFDLLTTRYGKPSAIKRSVVQNAFGAQFEKIEATWSLNDGSLIFHGVEERIDHGSMGLVAQRP